MTLTLTSNLDLGVDYNAPLGEDGGYTGKYEAVASALLEFDELSTAILVPERPDPNPAAKYPDVSFDDVLTYDSIASSVVSQHFPCTFILFQSSENILINVPPLPSRTTSGAS